MTKSPKKLVRELIQGNPYEYYPLGKHIVAATADCGRHTGELGERMLQMLR